MDEWIGFGVGERASGGYDRCSNVWKMPLQIKTRVVAEGTVLFQFTPLLTLSLGIHRGSNLFDKRFFPVKYWIVIAYAVSCCLLPKQTPYDL